ncbi:MAG: hypothetical protein K5639_00940 [Eubacterium sp.]|nr:hypothetical protein [Eubacterium sp.]
MRDNMRIIMKKGVAVFLAAVVMSITPLSDIRPISVNLNESNDKNIAKAAETGDGKYISDIKLAMGETSKSATAEALEYEKKGYKTLMKSWDPSSKDSNVCADLNAGAGTKSILKEGPNDKCVYLCYKTTDDPSEAITDMAVMNMNGGWSLEDYNALMEKYMNSQIKPFMNNFISTLKEYRKNLKKSSNSPGHIRAEYVKKMLNKFKDDDTGMTMGDLLEKETKYEMGDRNYEALYDDEKKNHADILTILTQGNGQAVLAIESLITKASDASGESWVDRLGNTTLDDLYDQYDAGSTQDTYIAMDKEYQDTAKRFLGEEDESGMYMRWDSFRQKAQQYKDILNNIEKRINKTAEDAENLGNNDALSSDMNSKSDIDKVLKYIEESQKIEGEVGEQILDIQTLSICDWLDSIEYGNGTLLDFFIQDSSKVSGEKNIRNLYPIVDALSAGQIAGLEFLSLPDLFTMAMADCNEDDYGFDGKDLYKQAYELVKDVDIASVYEKVDRGIYEKGAVALTDKAKRAKASAAEMESEDAYKLGTVPIVLWSVTAGMALATSVTIGIYDKFASGVYKAFESASIHGVSGKAGEELMKKFGSMKFLNARFSTTQTPTSVSGKMDIIGVKGVTLSPSKLFTGLMAGMVVITVIMIGVSAVATIADKINYYKTDFLPIPKYMVDTADITDKNGNVIDNKTAYYRAVEISRPNGPSKIEKDNYKAMGDRADLNGDIGKQWLALYTVKYTEGRPILTNSLLYQYDSETVPKGYSTGIHEFGSTAACNLNNPKYLYEKSLLSKAKPPVIKLFFKQEAKTIAELMEAKLAGKNAGDTASLFARGYGLVVGGGLLFIFLMGFIAVYGFRRRKAIEK